MIDIAVNSLGKYFGEKLILKDITFEIYEGQKVALIGKNGTGKTTLFHVITGELPYEEGSVSVHPSKKIGILDQMPSYPEGMTVRAVLEKAFEPLYALKKEIAELEKVMAGGDNDKKTLAAYGALLQRFEAMGGYETETELQKVSNGLHISKEMWERPYNKLSGGEMTRVNLARMLLEKTDIMLLDEPTNHLDMPSLEWLEERLETYKGTVLVISHDRFFLDRVTSRTIELAGTHATVYEGNYSYYVAAKEESEALQQKRYEREQREIDRLEFTSKRMHGWGLGDKKMMRRAFALDKRIERLKAAQAAPVKHDKKISASLEQVIRSGTDVLYVKGLEMGFGGKSILAGVDLEIKKDESIALLGENGCGKTTLLTILTGEREPLAGKVRWGSNIKLAYLPQQVSFQNEERTVLDTVVTELGLTEPMARNRLGVYLFRNDDVFKPVSVLSGGEKSRLKLCILLYQKINTLILDEPTNHLDIDSREWLEGLLEEFDGTMLFVSHDRYFIGRFATKIWHMEDGGITEFKGTYGEYRAALEREKALKEASGQSAQKKESPKERYVSPDRKRKYLERELEKAEAEISKTEDEIAALTEEIEKNAYDHLALEKLCAVKEEKDAYLNACYERWNAANENLEKFKKEAGDDALS